MQKNRVGLINSNLVVHHTLATCKGIVSNVSECKKYPQQFLELSYLKFERYVLDHQKYCSFSWIQIADW